ncbi:hypothetical protein E5676_scaffold332G001360 [Cucumis melo var. makuwa]|uniref:Uncharacterized protein n=1 Tax=Cucumis melo var. makuwa TaxID=1194695 RepID=A0A5D3CHH3_CUCMM|nr:hypothetical protein E5676_scaffold332G001360 [Cucumis melo var. makuwa]
MDNKTLAVIDENQPMESPTTETLTTDDNLTIVDATDDNLTIVDATDDNLTIVDATVDNLTIVDATVDNLTIIAATNLIDAFIAIQAAVPTTADVRTTTIVGPLLLLVQFI